MSKVKIKWNKESFSSLIQGLAQLDCAHVYHGDVSRCNCLIDKNNNVNFLDSTERAMNELLGASKNNLSALERTLE